MVIEAPPGVLAFIHPPSGDAITVNASGATVVLRGLTINGAGVTGNGMNVVAVAVLHVESCVITGFAWDFFNANGYGITFTSAGQLFVKDTIIRGNGNVGMWVAPSSGTVQASVDHCRLEQNNLGLRIGSSSKLTIRDSVLSGNFNHGVLVENGGEVNAEGCLVANNAYGFASIAAGTVLRASNCTVTDNALGLVASDGSLLSRSNNTVEGNGTDGSFTAPYSAK